MSIVKRLGKVYTPSEIVARMLVPVFSGSLKNVRICDPACGAGDFLVPVVEETCKRMAGASAQEQPAYIATLRQITGYDVDPEAVQHCRRRLSEVASRISGRAYADDFWRILQTDAMDAWAKDAETFDWVIGNPPYVRIQHLESYRRSKIKNAHWKYFHGCSDLYIVFFELGLRLLKDRGNLIFISPSSWIRNDAGKIMREDIEKNHGIAAFYDFRDHQVFSGVSTYTCITHIRKGAARTKSMVYQWNGKSFSNSYAIAKSGSRWAITDSNAIAKNGACDTVRLRDIADIRVGIQTLADKIFIMDSIAWKDDAVVVQNMLGERISIETNAVKKILKASVLKNGKDKMNRVIIYPYTSDGKLMPEYEFKETFPKAYSWLLKNKSRLLSRDKGAFDADKWYGYGREVGIRSALGHKILTSGMNLKPAFQVCEDPEALFYSGYCIKPRIDVDLNTLNDALNSPEMDLHVRTFSQPFRNGWYSYAKRYIQDFPVPNP